MLLKFLVTTLLWFFSYFILVPISWITIPFMLLSGWEGYSTLFGNRLYGKYGNKAIPADTFLKSYWFLGFRNPISNFGKETVSVKSTWKWPWHYEPTITLKFGFKFGWKENKDPIKNPERTFVYRPYIKKVE